MIPGTVLLSGVVGSTAYGLDHAGSDIDRIGIFARPTADLLGINAPKESYHYTEPSDVTWHEARKYLALALKANPTITELVWLAGHETLTDLGSELIAIRRGLLSARSVRNAYLGYATAQLKRLKDRGDGSFSADTRKRTAKHGRHLHRLCQQGTGLHETGELTIRLTDAQANACWDFGERVASDPDCGDQMIAEAEYVFDRPGVLPEQPDLGAAESWLRRVRAEFYRP
jgi:predicted nucleotidyltransferase